MSHPVADIFLKAADLNRTDDHCVGNVVEFRPGEHLVVAGDIHGRRESLAKVIAHANLSAGPERMLVLQEVIHGGPEDADGGDRSFELLMRAARLKSRHPGQIHFLLGNHDMAQLTGGEITKKGRGMCKAFTLGMANAFGDAAGGVAEAINEFFRSMPLAGRCPNGVFLAHSLPSPSRLEMFDPEILARPVQPADYKRGESVYELIWGRRHDAEALESLAQTLGVKLFINGHQPANEGYFVNDRQLVLATDGSLATIAEFDADQLLAAEDLGGLIRRVAKL